MLLVLLIDPALGRADPSSLSDQILVDILFDGMGRDKARFQDSNGDLEDVCKWDNSYRSEISCENDRVTRIKLMKLPFKAVQFPFDYIPALVEDFVVKECQIHGTLSASYLPPDLITFDVTLNRLFGEINFANFPRKLQQICLTYNAFSGSCSLDDLTETLKKIDVKGNRFTGEVSLNNLPKNLEYLNMQQNGFTGPISINRLPRPMRTLNMSVNAFSGDFKLLDVPPYLRSIYIGANPMSGRAIFRESSAEMTFKLLHSCIQKVVDESGNTHSWEGVITANGL